jgi:hypothetical protein
MKPAVLSISVPLSRNSPVALTANLMIEYRLQERRLKSISVRLRNGASLIPAMQFWYDFELFDKAMVVSNLENCDHISAYLGRVLHVLSAENDTLGLGEEGIYPQFPKIAPAASKKKKKGR